MGEKEACPDKTVIIDIPEDLEPDLDKTCWIQRVPRKLRKVNEAAYTPTLVSIGPFHHGKPTLKAMEDHKAKYYQKFWERDFCKHIREKDMIRDFTGELGGQIRNSYAVTFDQPLNDGNHFFEVIFRDSCFIFELFLRNLENLLCRKKPEDIKDYILRTPWLRKAIELDLIMVENQLPFFVFTKLLDFILKNQPESLTIPFYLSKQQKESERRNFITRITCEFFLDYYWNGKVVDMEKKSRRVEKDGRSRSTADHSSERKAMQRLVEKSPYELEDIKRFEEIKHFTDLVRQFLRPDKYVVDSVDSAQSANCCYSAKELDRAGVYFSPRKNKFLADIIHRKEGGFLSWKPLTLKIPQFKVEGNTECLMRNVMALEQCLYPYQAHICNYISLLGQLINTEEDVEFLVKKKVVDNILGSNKVVADLINTLCDEIVETKFCYGDICKQLNEHSENWWNVTKATLRRVYFKDIWTGSSTVVAVIVLIFSIVSVIATIKDLFF